MERSVKGIWIPIEIWNDKRLTALDRVILAEIDSLDGEEHCFASNQYLAEFCGCSETHASKAISKLISLGYLSVVSFNGRSRCIKCNFRYQLEHDESTQKSLLNEQGRVVKLTRQSCQIDKAGLSNEQGSNIYNNILNNNNEKIEEKTTNITTNQPLPTISTNEFDLFWTAYPNKQNKKYAQTCFLRALHRTSLETILEAIEKQKQYKEKLANAKQFVPSWPHPSSWLNQNRWEDDADISTEEPTSKVYDHQSFYWKQADWLSRKINQVHPTIALAKEETLQKWAYAFDKMVNQDGHPKEEILSLWRFVFADEYWNDKITTPWDLNKNYIKILSKMQKVGNSL